MRALVGLAVVAFSVSLAVPAPGQGDSPLAGTSWRLVKFKGGDGQVIKPADPSRYTLELLAGGALAARIDCNRAGGSWKSEGPAQLELRLGAMTRAMCPPGSLHDQIVKQWPSVRSYVIKDGHLFLSLMADGGTYEFEPVPIAKAPAPPPEKLTSPVPATGPVTFQCDDGTALTATYYKTEPGLAVLARGGETRVAFVVRAASGAKYQGEGLLFWEARGEATVTWGQTETKCRPGK